MSRIRPLSILLLSGLMALPCAQAAPFGGAAMRAQTRAISGAIGHQARAAVRPRFIIQSRYAGAMNGVAVSADGRRLYSASSTSGAQVWGLEDGQLKHSLRGHDGALFALAAQGDLIATAGADSTVRLWNGATGEEGTTLKGHRKPVMAVAIDARGQRVVSGGADWEARVWDAASGRTLKALKGHRREVTAVLFTGEKEVATASADGRVLLWDAQSGAQRQELAHGSPVLTLAVSHDGKRLLSGAQDGKVRLWSLPDGKLLRTLSGDGAAVRAVAFSPNGSRIAAGDAKGLLRLWGEDDKPALFSGHEGAINAIAFLPDGKRLFSASADRTLRLWESGGKELARLVMMLDGWAVVSPDGWFDGTLDGREEDRVEAIKWAVEKTEFALDGFLEGYYLPGLLGRVMGNVPLVATRGVSPPSLAEEGFLLPPEVAIEEPDLADGKGRKVARITVRASDAGGDIDEIRLYHNGKIVDDSDVAAKESEQDGAKLATKSYEVPLIGGENRFRAIGLSRARIESRPAEVLIPLGKVELGSTRGATLHLVIIGINQYRNADLTLNFGVPDARGILEQLRTASAGLFDKVAVHSLFDGDATRERIDATFRELRDTEPEDVVAIFLAGHGDSVGDRWFFVPHELTHPEEQERLTVGGFSSDELRSRIAAMGAQRVLLLMDACKSGAAVSAFDKFDEHRPVALLARSTGIHIGAAATGAQYASEIGTLGHGVFTYSLLQALKGQADRLPSDGQVSVNEMMQFVQGYMPRLIRKYRLPNQSPVLNSRGGDFALVKGSP